MADPKGFLKYPREGPKRRPVELRIQDWKEFYEPISEDTLKARAAWTAASPSARATTDAPSST